MTRAELKAALERDRDENAKELGDDYERRGWGDWAPGIASSGFFRGADSRTDDILDLVEALEKNKAQWEKVASTHYSQLVAWQVASTALKKLYAKYGGGK